MGGHYKSNIFMPTVSFRRHKNLVLQSVKQGSNRASVNEGHKTGLVLSEVQSKMGFM